MYTCFFKCIYHSSLFLYVLNVFMHGSMQKLPSYILYVLNKVQFQETWNKNTMAPLQFPNNHILMRPQAHDLMKVLRRTYRGCSPRHSCLNRIIFWDGIDGLRNFKMKETCCQATLLNQLPLLCPNQIWIFFVLIGTSVRAHILNIVLTFQICSMRC